VPNPQGLGGTIIYKPVKISQHSHLQLPISEDRRKAIPKPQAHTLPDINKQARSSQRKSSQPTAYGEEEETAASKHQVRVGATVYQSVQSLQLKAPPSPPSPSIYSQPVVCHYGNEEPTAPNQQNRTGPTVNRPDKVIHEVSGPSATSASRQASQKKFQLARVGEVSQERKRLTSIVVKLQLNEANPEHWRKQLEKLEEAQEEAMRMDYLPARRGWKIVPHRAFVEKTISNEGETVLVEENIASKQEQTEFEEKKTVHQLREEAIAVATIAVTRRTQNRCDDINEARG
jgi:hypothetical protein